MHLVIATVATIIILGIIIIETWFYEKMTGQEVVAVSLIRYTNKGICIK